MSLTVLLIIFSCNKTPKNISGQKSKNTPNPISYEFIYNGLTINYNGNKKQQAISGTVLLFEKEVQILRGNVGEKYFVKKVSDTRDGVILTTFNDRGDKMYFRFFKTDNKSHIEVDMNGTLANFNITKGDIDYVPFYGLRNNEVKSQDTSAKKITKKNAIKKARCNCEKIKRDDGSIVVQCSTLPVASDNSTQLGFALLSNGQEKFISVTVRFKRTAQEITGNLTLQLEDNNLITMNLVNNGLSSIGNSQVAHAIFSTTQDQLKKIRLSSLKTISIKIGNSHTSTYKAEINNDIFQHQLLCL